MNNKELPEHSITATLVYDNNGLITDVNAIFKCSIFDAVLIGIRILEWASEKTKERSNDKDISVISCISNIHNLMQLLQQNKGE